MAVSERAWDAAQFEGLYRCVHCGLCLQACPTYCELGVETDSPRGRLYLMRAMVEGRLELSEGVATHMHRCLVCRACETACPSGVPFGHLMELTRDRIRQELPPPPASSLARKVMLRHVFPHRRRLELLGRLAKAYQRSGLQRAVRASRLLPAKLAEAEQLTPEVSDQPFQAPPDGWFRTAGSATASASDLAASSAPSWPESGTEGPEMAPGVAGFDAERAKYRVGLLAGCIMSVAFAGIDRATVRVLNRNGCDVFVPLAQTCCGALHAHDGDRRAARALARRNVDAFECERLDAVIMNAAGCGATMKDYGELLHDDPAYAERAAAFSARVKDVTEFLAGIDFDRRFGRIERTVTFQDPCHLAHGQRIREAPRTLLRAIPGLQLVEMKDSDRCCGSAGIYNITQPDLSRRFMAEKAQCAAATGAQEVVSANPGCIIQVKAGLRQRGARMAVKHIVEILDEAYQRGE